MPMDRGTPDLVRHCVAAVADQYGGDVDKAFAICVATLQKAGYLKKGTMELTAAGKKKEAEHDAEPDAKKKLKAYEDFLKAAKETRKAEREETQAEAFTRDFNLLLNPTKRTGLEAVPRPIARKYETVTKQESSMDFMRRLAGITTRYEDRSVRAKPVVEGMEMKVTKALEDAGFSSHDFHFEDGLIAHSLTTAYEMAKALAKSKQFGSVSVEPMPKGRAKLTFGKAESSMAAVVKQGMEEPRYGFTGEDGGKFVLLPKGSGFVVEPVGANSDEDAADLYTYMVRKATSMKDAVKLIQKRVKNAPRYDEARETASGLVQQAAKGQEKGYKCLECGKKFSTAKAAAKAMDYGCPKCGGSDIDLA